MMPDQQGDLNASLNPSSTETYSWSLLNVEASKTTFSPNADIFTSPQHPTHTTDSVIPNADIFTSPLHLTHTTDSALTLQQLNDEKARLYIPVIVYMAVLFTIGTVGNIVAIIVYADVKKKSSADYFILCVSILDLLGCVVGMPTEIYDLSFPYLYRSSTACKILAYIQSCVLLPSGVILVLIAFERYFLICKISRSHKASTMKKISIMIIAVSFVICIPTGVIYGIKTVETGIDGVNGYECSIDDTFRHTVYPVLWFALHLLAFVITVIITSILYTRISYEVWKRKKIMASQMTDTFQMKNGANYVPDSKHGGTIFYTSNISESSDISTENGATSAIKISKNNSDIPNNPNPDRNDELIQKNMPQNQSRSSRSNTLHPLRTTLILFLVTLVFVLSFLPFLVVTVLQSVIRDFDNSVDDSRLVFRKFCLKSYFINNAGNPLIYSFLNASFRQRVISKLKSLFCKKRE